MTRWWRSWVPLLRLAARDARRHRARTLLATLLVALPVAALVGGVVLTSSATPARETALASVPRGVQAVVTATAITRPAAPFPQLPEGAPGPWTDDTAQAPATSQELAALLPPGDRLLPYWNARDLLATTGLPLEPGEQVPAGSGVEAVGSLELDRISKVRVQEAGPEALALLLPPLASGAAPGDATEAVLTTAVAERLGARLGDVVTVIAPPFSGWFSSDGRIGEVVQDSQRAYRVAGLVEDDAERAWVPAGWLSAMVEADPVGVDGHHLVIGDEPVTWEHARAVNELQAFAVSRHVLTDGYPTPDQRYPVAVDPAVALTQLTLVVVAGAVGAALVLFLVTPAFAVSAEQARRTLGLAAASGASPAHLRRTITAQGLVVGAAGGVLGAAGGGVAGGVGYSLLNPDAAVPVHPWWVLPVGVAVAVLLGVVATLLPARWAGRQQPVDALKQRPTHPDAADGAPRGRARRLAADAVGPALVVLAVVLAGISLVVPVDLEIDPAAPSYSPPASVTVPLVLAMGCGVLGLVLSTRLVLALAQRLAGRAPLAVRAALRDAHDHPSRSVPAASAVLVTALAAAFLAVQVGSGVANERDRSGEFVAPGALVVGAAVPVSTAVDGAVLADAVDVLAQDLPVTGHHPVHSPPSGGDVVLSAAPAPGEGCPGETSPDTASAVRQGAPLTCVPWDRAYSPGQRSAWMGGSDVHVMSGDALRASGLPGADAAADVLDAGGAVVNDATRLSADDVVRVVAAASPFPEPGDPQSATDLPGAFVRGFAPPLTLAPETAAALGLADLQHVGEVVVTARPVGELETARARYALQRHTTLASVVGASAPHPWGTTSRLLPVLALGALAVLATTVCLLLARTQSRGDLATMHAVGASPRFVRRFTVAQAVVVLAAGLPIGAVAGIALGAYQVAWNRRLGVDGAWLVTEPLWSVQVATWVAVVGVGLGTAWVLSRPPRALTRRAAD